MDSLNPMPSVVLHPVDYSHLNRILITQAQMDEYNELKRRSEATNMLTWAAIVADLSETA